MTIIPTGPWKWQLYDPYLPETYTLEVNPNDETVQATRNFTYSKASDPTDGLPILFEGRPDPNQITLKGTLLTQNQYLTLERWQKKPYQFLVTDDLGRTRWMLPQEWNPERKWTRSHPWRHDWTWTLLLVDWGNPPSFGITPEAGAAPGAVTMGLRQVGDDGRGNGYVEVSYSATGSPPPTFEVYATEGLNSEALVWTDQAAGAHVFLVPVGVAVSYRTTATNLNGTANSASQSLTVA